jgi:hypothetical protein
MGHKKACKNCEWWLGDDESLFSECARFPAWVETEPRHYCGEYRLSNEKKRAKPAPKKENYAPVFETYGKEFGKYFKKPFSGGGKASGQLVQIAKQRGIDGAIEYIQAFFANPPKWNRENDAFSPGALLACQDNFEIHNASKAKTQDLNNFAVFEARKAGLTPVQMLEYRDFIKKSGKRITAQEWLND